MIVLSRNDRRQWFSPDPYQTQQVIYARILREFARLYKQQMTLDNIAECLQPKFDVELKTVIEELEAIHAER